MLYLIFIIASQSLAIKTIRYAYGAKFTPRSVQLVARMIKTLTSMRNSRFRATSCTLQFTKIENRDMKIDISE